MSTLTVSIAPHGCCHQVFIQFYWEHDSLSQSLSLTGFWAMRLVGISLQVHFIFGGKGVGKCWGWEKC